MSTHEIPVIRLDAVESHPYADNLEIVNIYGWSCCVRKNEFKSGDLIVYVPPDYLVDVNRPEFSFLSDPLISVKKLRGVVSQGLVIKADSSLKEGDNALQFYGITRYNPPEPTGEEEKAPKGIFCPHYSVESFHRYHKIIPEGEDVFVTEKLHGISAKYVFSSVDNKMYCGSRIMFLKDSQQNVPWQCLKLNQWIENWCRNNPDTVLYGEIFGRIQKKLKYGTKHGLFFAAFDILTQDVWANYETIQKHMSCTLDANARLKWAPILYVGPFDVEKIKELAEMNSQWPGAEDQISEGVVIRPTTERVCLETGRVQLKLVSNNYLGKKR